MENTTSAPIASRPGLVNKLETLLSSRPVFLQFLKFAGIGFLTSALDFLVLNLLSKLLGIEFGFKLGGVNIVSFVIALAHSYMWNSNWAFGEQGTHVWKTFWRSIIVGTIGVIGIVLAIVGGKAAAPAIYYLLILGILAVIEIIIWNSFSLGRPFFGANSIKITLATFIAVSIIGTLINSGLISLLTTYWHFTSNLDLNKNIAKVIATAFSLIWNFFGYKLIVFKK